MPESRDRSSQPDPAAFFFVPRRVVGGILLDIEPEGSLNRSPSRIDNGGRQIFFGSPFRRGATTVTPSRGLTEGPMHMAASRGLGMERAANVTSRFGNGRGRTVFRSSLVGSQNTPSRSCRRGRGRSTNSPLPYWYPRTPLQDITEVVRAIERGRSRLGEAAHHQFSSPLQRVNVLDPTLPVSGAPLEHFSTISPNMKDLRKPSLSPVGCLPNVLLGINNQGAGESDFVTPQKKLLNSIEQVEKAVMAEFQKMKRTPAAKKAERQNKVRTLMSIR